MNPALLQSSLLFGKKSIIGFKQIPKDFINKKNIDKCVENMQDQLSVSTYLSDQERNAQIKDLQDYYTGIDKQLADACKALPDSEQKIRHEMHQKCVENYTRSYAPLFFNNDHLENDFSNRYFANNIMHRTSNEAEDRSFNERVSQLLARAQNGEFADTKEELKNPNSQLSKDREEFLGHIRNYVDKIKKLDLEKVSKDGISDEELIKDPLFYTDISRMTTQYDDIRSDLTKWGISDQHINETIEQYFAFSDYFSMCSKRIGYILEPAFEIFDEKVLPFESVIGTYDPSNSGASEYICSAVRAKGEEYQVRHDAEQKSIKRLFTDLGFPENDIVWYDPSRKKDITSLTNPILMGIPFTLHSKSHPEIQMTFNSYNDMKYTRIMMIEKTADFHKVVEKPKALNFWDKCTDFFSSILGKGKPKAEKYEKDVKKYNDLAVIFDPKSVIPTEPPVQKTPLHDLLGVRHLLQQKNKTKENLTEIMDRLNEVTANIGPQNAALQNSVKTLTEKFGKQVDAYNEAHPNPEDKIVLKGPVASMMQTIKQQAALKAQQEIKKGIINEEIKPEKLKPEEFKNVQNKKNIIDENIIEEGGHGPQNPQDIIGGSNPEIKKEEPKQEIKKEEPKQEIKKEIKKEEPKPQPKFQLKLQPEFKPIPAKKTDVKSLGKELEIAKLYCNTKAAKNVLSLLEGRVSLHKQASKDVRIDPSFVSAAALLGQAPENFPGKKGLTPMERKMQYLQRVFTEKDFTKKQEHQQFLAKCCTDYKSVRDSAYQNAEKDSNTIREFVSYLNEGAKSMQHLAVSSPRMTVTVPMLGICSALIQKEIANSMDRFNKDPHQDIVNDKGENAPQANNVEKQSLLSSEDRVAMSNVNARCSSIRLLSQAYIDGLQAKLKLTQEKYVITRPDKDEQLRALMIAEGINQTVIAPTNREAAQYVKENQHPIAENLTSLGEKPVDKKLCDIQFGINRTSTFNALKDVEETRIAAAILKQPAKITALSMDISAELLTGKDPLEQMSEKVSKMFDPKNTLKETNINVPQL